MLHEVYEVTIKVTSTSHCYLAWSTVMQRGSH